MTVRAELVRIPTATFPLDGLFYPLPPGQPPVGGAMVLHGTSKNFYRGPARFLPGHLLDIGVETLACNRRDHDVLATIGRDPEGGAFQTYAAGLDDVGSIAHHLAERGHAEPIVIGHSNGGLLAAAFAASHPRVRALVLLSAHAGGPDSVARDSAAGLLARDRLEEFTTRARRLIDDGRGDELMLLPGWWYLATAASFLDRSENAPDLLGLAERVSCPALVLRGGREDERRYPTEAFADRCAAPVTTAVVGGAGHHYDDREHEVGGLVADWLREVVLE